MCTEVLRELSFVTASPLCAGIDLPPLNEDVAAELLSSLLTNTLPRGRQSAVLEHDLVRSAAQFVGNGGRQWRATQRREESERRGLGTLTVRCGARTADGAPLLEPADRNAAALSKGGGDRDNRQEKGSEKRGEGGEESESGSRQTKSKGEEQVQTGKQREKWEEAKVRSASEMRGLRAYLALETPNFPVKPSQPRCTATEGESRVPR